MSLREVKYLLGKQLRMLSDNVIDLDLNIEPQESVETTPTRRSRRPREVAASSHPNDTVNQGSDSDSEEEDNDSSSDKTYRLRQSGKRKIPERNVDGINSIREPKKLRKKRKTKTARRKNNRIEENATTLVVELGRSDIPQAKTENRVERMVNYLQDVKETNEEMDVDVLLVSIDERELPNLKASQVTCSPKTTIGSLCEVIALNTGIQSENIEMYVIKELAKDLKRIDTSMDEVVSVNKEQDVGGLKMNNINYGFVLLGYKKIDPTLQLLEKIGSTQKDSLQFLGYKKIDPTLQLLEKIGSTQEE